MIDTQPECPPLSISRDIEVHPGIWISVPTAPWNDRDREAWRVSQKLLPDQWAETFVRLDRGAIPGPWRNDNAAYLRGIMNIACARGVERLSIKKGAQAGVSAACRVLMGYWAHNDPSPMGLALPSKEKGRQIVGMDVIPFFKKNFSRHPELRALLSARLHDMKKGLVQLVNEFILFLMWSGSATSMASDVMKRAISDEVNKFVAWTGNDADPISLIEKRMRTYPDRIHILISTPTIASDPISQYFNSSHVKLYYRCPCPHCGAFQRLLFGEGGNYGIKWCEEIRSLQKEGRRDLAEAKALQTPDGVWYECCSCHGRINERQKREMVRAGKWGTIGEDRLTSDGNITDAESVEQWPNGTRIGMHISSIYCCWENWTMSHIAAEFLAAATMSQKFAFRTSTLGEDWEQAAEQVDISIIDERVKEAPLPEGKLPRWTGRLLASVDTQQDHFWVVIRAWGPGMRSQRVWHGKVFSFQEIEQYCFQTPWANEDARLPAWTVDKIIIDSGGSKKYDQEEDAGSPLPSRVMDVYAWALSKSAHVHVIKGDSRPTPGLYMRRGEGVYVNGSVKKRVPIWLLDVHHFHDELADLMGRLDDEIDRSTGEVLRKVPAWELNKRNDPEYHQHIANMHLIQELEKRTKKLVYRWRPKRDGLRVDYRACEAYQVAGAYLAGVHQLPDLPTYLEAIEAEIAHRNAPRAPATPLIETPDGRPFLATQRGDR